LPSRSTEQYSYDIVTLLFIFWLKPLLIAP
jgi:hypothetical protein